jgi:hypothetical protein
MLLEDLSRGRPSLFSEPVLDRVDGGVAKVECVVHQADPFQAGPIVK